MLVSATHRYGSALGAHVSPPSWPPSHARPTPALSAVTELQCVFPEVYCLLSFVMIHLSDEETEARRGYVCCMSTVTQLLRAEPTSACRTQAPSQLPEPPPGLLRCKRRALKHPPCMSSAVLSGPLSLASPRGKEAQTHSRPLSRLPIVHPA